MNIFCILIIPVALASLPAVIKRPKTLGMLNAAGYLLVLLGFSWFILKANLPVSFFKLFYIDSLSAFFIFTISIITFATALFSIDYI